jgi:uncharacterized protein YjlB
LIGMTRERHNELVTFPLAARASFPNNPRLPALLYRGAFALPKHGDAAQPIERTFARNDWSGGWRDGVFNYHHYHSNAHEALGCYSGRASLMLGGPEGEIVELTAGDVLVLPAGVAHKSTECSADFKVVGAYAHGVSYDMRRANDEHDAEVARRIAEVPLPAADPVLGANGPMFEHWR